MDKDILNYMVKDIFYYYKDAVDVSDLEVFSLVLEGVHTTAELLEVYARQFNFPSYFGYNWDALKDSLCYLDEWMQEKRIVIIHKDMPRLEESELRIYIRVLYGTCELWRKYPDVLQMKVYFSECNKDQVGKILQDINSRLAMEQSLTEPPKTLCLIIKWYKKIIGKR